MKNTEKKVTKQKSELDSIVKFDLSELDSLVSIALAEHATLASDITRATLDSLACEFLTSDMLTQTQTRVAELELNRVKNFAFDSVNCTRRNNDLLINAKSVKTSQTAQSLSIIMLSATMTRSLVAELDFAEKLINTYESSKLAESDIFDFTIENTLAYRTTRKHVIDFVKFCLTRRADFESLSNDFDSACKTRFVETYKVTKTRTTRTSDSADIAE